MFITRIRTFLLFSHHLFISPVFHYGRTVMNCGVRNVVDRSRYLRNWQPPRHHVKSWGWMTAAATLHKASQLPEVSKLRMQLRLHCWVRLTSVCLVVLSVCQAVVASFGTNWYGEKFKNLSLRLDCQAHIGHLSFYRPKGSELSVNPGAAGSPPELPWSAH